MTGGDTGLLARTGAGVNAVLLPPDDCPIAWSPGERLHDLYDHRCRLLGPEAGRRLAVDYGGFGITFTDLQSRSHQVAHHLRGLGVGPGKRVAMLLGRTVDAYASVLALSRLGASAVPLDAGFPDDRIRFLLDDSGTSHVLTLAEQAERFRASACAVVTLDHDGPAIHTRPRTGATLTTDRADAECYVIYTSGSTGRPKGVPIRHASIVNFLRVAVDRYGFRPTDRVHQGLTTAFDYSFEEIWVPLLSGSTLVPAPPGAQLVGDDLRDHLVEHRITALATVPTVLATVRPPLDALRLLLVSGEACPADVIEPWFGPDRRILNLYGPTETTVSCTWGVMAPGRPVTIGRPLPTYRILILDPDRAQALPPGETGEITVAGIGLADGYLNRPEQTAAAFVPDVVGVDANPGGMLYRTGDLGRVTPWGEVEYLGRIDTQVKIRGYRIELSEIEVAARRVAGVANAVAMPHTPPDGTPTLALWVAPADPGLGVDLDALDAALRAELPAYMVPAFVEVIDEVPLLPSGKADRKALPAPVARRARGDGDLVAPRTPVEARLAELLAETLGLPAVSVEADFFDELGADSLTLAAYVTSLRSALGVRRVTLKQLYQHSNIAALATVLPPGAVPEPPPAEPVAEAPPPNPRARPAVPPRSADPAPPHPLPLPPPPLAPPPSTLTPSALTPSAQPPSALTPSAQPPSALTRSVLSPSTLTPSALTPSAQPPSALTPPAGLAVGPATEPDPTWPPVRVAGRAARTAAGLAQLAAYGIATFVASAAVVALYHWVAGAGGWLDAYLRLVVGGVGLWLATVVTLIGVKWAAVGRMDETPIPLWSARYVRFWIARRAIELNPMVLLAGTPAYNLYLRALGTDVGARAVILTRPPVCCDLVSIGADAVVREEVVLTGYEAVNGWLIPGPVTVGDGALVGDGSVLAPGSVIGDGAQLGPASGLLSGQRVPDGEIWQGSPAEPSTARFDHGDPAPVSGRRRAAFTAGQLVTLWLIGLPTALLPALLAPRLEVTSGQLTGGGPVGVAAGLVLAGFVSLVFAVNTAAALTLVVPRILHRFVVPERSHPLYGAQYGLARAIARYSNNRFLNTIFGDSAMIVGWLSSVGYDLSRSTQTGSNFGVDQRHHNPFQCSFDRNTLVSDGLRITNLEVSATTFRLRTVAVPPDTYLGNVVRYPADARIGPNCLIATKAAVPVDGPIRSGVGILGSPAFEIPRTVQRDRAFDLYKQPGIIEQRLALKLRSNVVTMLAYLARWWLLASLGIGITAGSLALFDADRLDAPVMAAAAGLTVSAFAFTLVSALISIGLERAALGFGRLGPLYCSLYDERFWAHERFWKLNYNAFLRVFDGTPFKPWFLRLQGAEVGAGVFDDGAGLTEPSLVRIGDGCMLNQGATLQAHSLEDGTFKSDRISLGRGVVVGTGALVHYGTDLGDGCRIDADSFVMKGASVESGARWQGNPARAVATTATGDAVPFTRTPTEGALR